MWAHTHTGARMPNIFEIQYTSVIIYSSPSPPLPYVQLGRTMINSGSNAFAAGLKSVYCISLQPKSRVVSGSRMQCALQTHTAMHFSTPSFHCFPVLLPQTSVGISVLLPYSCSLSSPPLPLPLQINNMMEEGLIEEALLMAQALTEAEKHRDPEAEDVGGARGGGRGRGWMESAECGCYHCQSREGVILFDFLHFA